MARDIPEQKYLEECFTYDPESGILKWKERPLHHHKLEREVKRFNTNYAGKEAGRLTTRGYREVVLDGNYFPTHRLIFKLVTGEDPENHLDHINGDKSDNRWYNLREATSTQNNHNRRISKNNTTGYKGVSRHKNRFKSSIRVGNGKRIFLGYFNTAEEAYEAYCKACEEYHKEFANKG